MLLPILVFLVGAGAVFGAYAAVTYIPTALAGRHLDRRLRDVAAPASDPAVHSTVLMRRSRAHCLASIGSRRDRGWPR